MKIFEKIELLESVIVKYVYQQQKIKQNHTKTISGREKWSQSFRN